LKLERAAYFFPLREENLMTVTLNREAVVHVRFDGRSLDVPLALLGVGERPGDAELLRAVARHLEVAEEQLSYHVVDRHQTGNLTVRPEAVFG
jgi:hypothetical protein